MSLYDLGTVDYSTAWALQRAHGRAQLAGAASDGVMCLQHPAVYTLGRGTPPVPAGRPSRRATTSRYCPLVAFVAWAPVV